MSLNKIDYLKYLVNIYFLKKGTITKSWCSPSKLSEDSLDQPAVQWAYPIDFSKDIHENLLSDNSDIPVIDYANLGIHYNPWFIGHIALGYFSIWKKENEKKHLDNFEKLANWFFENKIETEQGVTWVYHFDYFGGQKKPWKSGLSQAHAISVLLRAATVLNKEKYIDTARKAVNELTTHYDKGGPALDHEDGTVSFEEYFYDPPYTVLNGHLFAAFACWEASAYFKDESLTELADDAFLFVKKNISKYDLGFWSAYSLKRVSFLNDIASFHYHNVHISQLQSAYKITGDLIFQSYAQKFRMYENRRIYKFYAFIYKSIVKVIS